MDGFAPNARRHSPSEITTTGSTFGRSSASVYARPMRGRTPSTSNMLEVAKIAFTRSGRVPSLTFTAWLLYAAMSVYDLDRSRSSRYSGGETQNLSKPSVGNWLVMNTRRSEFG